MADQCKVSAAIVAESEEKSYVFKVHGYSRAKELFKNGEYLASPPCSVGGYNWVLWYFPNGYNVRQAGHIWTVLYVNAKDVKAKARLSILDKDGVPAPSLIKEKTFPDEGRRMVVLISRRSWSSN